ncbi:MAG: prepilin-type N-terminal cleavage/methylation domain-containing protein [Gammaproteobacteria bacterium]|jgi:prepilin-type N-terminal cleavage/methylation domain-containing protein
MKRAIRGFTLIELLVVMTISTGLVLALGILYRTVGNVSATLSVTRSEWSAEQFMRQQFWLIHPLSTDLGLFQGEANRVTFVTSKSARYGEHGPLVLVRYQYDPTDEVLTVAESDLPPWWSADAERRARQTLAFDADWWRETALHNISEASFQYFSVDKEGDQWTPTWNRPKRLPQLVRLRYEQLGSSKEIVFEAGVTSSFMRSGY